MTDPHKWVIHGERLVDDTPHIRVSLADVELPNHIRFTHHVQGASRVAGGVACLAEVAEALRHAGRQVRLVEVGQPCRVVLAGGAVEGPLCPGEDGAAGAGVVAGRVPVGFHDQALGEQGRRPVADGCGLGGSGEVDRLIGPGQVQGLVRLGGEYLCGEGVVAGVPGVGQGLGEVPLGEAVLVAVVGDPAG